MTIAAFRQAGTKRLGVGLSTWMRSGAVDLVAVTFALSAIGLVIGAFFAIAGPYSLDEAIYILMAEAARDGGRLSIPNGYNLYPSEALKILFLREGPLGLVPQYPSGYGFLALPFYLVGGVRGLILMNVLAHIAAMGATYGLARQLETSREIALAAALIFGCGTFALAYAVGIWPHAVAVAITCGSALAIVAATRAENARKGLRLALIGGLLLGFGVTIRVDVILLVPPVLLWLSAQRKQWTKATLYLAGLAPGLLLASWFNWLKFGSWLPVTYGSDVGGTSLSAHWPLFPAIALAMAVALALASPRVRALCSLRNLLLIGAAGLLLILALAETRSTFLKAAAGFYILLIDFQAYHPAAWEEALFRRTEGGHLLIADALKRALLQSLPALGVLPLVMGLFREERRSARAVYLFLLISALFWILPFALRQWHGGSPQHMRYFLPVLPFLSVLMAIAFARLFRDAGFAGRRGQMLLLGTGVITGIAVLVVFIGVHQDESWALSVATRGALALAGATAAATLLVLVGDGRFRRTAARAGLALGAAALVWGGVSSFAYDTVLSQDRRRSNAQMNDEAARLPNRALIVTRTSYRFMPQLLRPDSFVAAVVNPSDAGERGLIEYHLAQGRKVYLDGPIARMVLNALGEPPFTAAVVPFGQNWALLELRPTSTSPDARETAR